VGKIMLFQKNNQKSLTRTFLGSSKIFRFLLLFYATILILFLSGCSKETCSVSKSPPPDLTGSTFLEYTPKRNSVIKLEFKYPNYWVMCDEYEIFPDGLVFLHLSEPEMLTLPTRAPDEPTGTPSDYGRINISAEELPSGETMESFIARYFDNVSSASFVEILDRYQIKIDGQDAQVLEYQIEPISENNGYSVDMFARDILVELDQKVYIIIFVVPLSDRGGLFEDGYEALLDSINFLD
jgi:hypothetical protein